MEYDQAYEERSPGDLLRASRRERQKRDTERAEASFYEFVKQAWDEVDPANPYVDSWHMGAICEHMQALHTAQIQHLIINIPPGFGKSILACVLFPAWEWTTNPMLRYMTGSFSEEFAIRDSMKARRLMESTWYQERWGDKFRLGGADLQSAKGRYENDKSGYRIAFGIMGGIGERADRMFMDDPHQTRQAVSDADRERAVTSYRSTMPSRANNVATAAWLIIMQRLHQLDLSGQMMEFGYACLKIPMRYDPSKPWKKILVDFKHVDPRTEFGQLLFPQRVPEQYVAGQELIFGSYMTSGQYQQEPSPADGGIFKRKWFCKFWQRPQDNLPAYVIRIGGEEVSTELMTLDESTLEEEAMSIDCTFKDVKDSDFVAIQRWGRKKADRFILDQRLARLDFPATIASIRDVAKLWPRTTVKLVEDKANGSAVISTLRHEIPGMIAVSPEGGKESRAQAVSPQFEAGNIWLPHPNLAPWVLPFIEQFVSFPNGAHDDCVDAASQILNRWLGGWMGLIEFLKREMAEEDQNNAVAMKRKEAIATGAQTEKCERCGSVAVTWLASQGYRCSQCGNQWGGKVRVIPGGTGSRVPMAKEWSGVAGRRG